MNKKLLYTLLLACFSFQLSFAEGDDDKNQVPKKIPVSIADSLKNLEGDVGTDDTLVFEDYDDIMIKVKEEVSICIIPRIESKTIRCFAAIQESEVVDPIDDKENSEFANGISEFQNNSSIVDVVVYPNPARQSSSVHVDITGMVNAQISLYSLNGELIKTQTESEINLYGLVSGTYIVSIADQKSSFTKRLMVY